MHYLAFGTPFLTYKFLGLETLFEIGKEILCFENPNILSSVIDSLFSHPEKLVEIGKAGQKKVIDDYNNQKVAQYIIDVVFRNEKSLPSWGEHFVLETTKQ